jgi:hypothetical protein
MCPMRPRTNTERTIRTRADVYGMLGRCLTLDEISQKTGISVEGVHYFLSEHFGLSCIPPAVSARRRQQESRA